MCVCMGGGGEGGGKDIATTKMTKLKTNVGVSHISSNVRDVAAGWWMPFSDHGCGTLRSHRANEHHQSVTSVTSSTRLEKLTNDQKGWLTWFILSKVNVQNNKKHVSERDMVQSKSTDLEKHSAPISAANIKDKKGINLKTGRHNEDGTGTQHTTQMALARWEWAPFPRC